MARVRFKPSIQSRLAFGLGVMLLPLIALGVTSFRSSQSTAKALEKVTQTDQEELKPVQALQMLALMAAMPPNDYLIIGDKSERAEFDQLQQKVNAAFDALMNSKVASRSENRDLLEEAYMGWVKARLVGQEILSTERPLAWAGNSKQMKVFDEHIDQIAETLNRLTEKIRVENKQLEIEARRVQHQASFFFFTIFVLAALTMVAVGLFVFRSVTTAILEQEQAEKLLQENQAMLAQSQSMAHVGSWVLDLGINRLTWSDEVYRIFGMTPLTFPDNYEAFLQAVHPEDRIAVEKAYSDSMQHGKDSYEIDHRIIRQDTAEIRFVHEKCLHIRDKAGVTTKSIGMVQDITERKQAETALRESDQRFRDLVESSDGIVWEADAITFAFTSISGNAERLLGYQDSDWLLPDFWASHLHPNDREHAIQFCVSCTGRMEDHEFEYRFLAKDGRVVWLRDIVKVIEEHGKPRWLRGLMVDITNQKMAAENTTRLHAQLQQSQKMESLGTLAGGVAHDMNNVLGAILGLSSAHIGTQPYGSPLHQALSTICKATERGGKMVKSLLSFARQSPVENQKLDINAILREQVSLLERTTLATVRLQLDLERELLPILGDANALTHAFMNLCVNAVDAMPQNGTLTLHTRNVDSDWIEVVVEDNGMGMPKEVLEKAMDPFFTTKETGKGTGLGLSMVFSTVKAHQGQMVIESEPGLGTCVRLRIPVYKGGMQDAEPEVSDATMTHQRSLNVLLVDDDDLIHGSVLAILEALGHTTVTTAMSGEGALAKLEAGLEADLVILDMNMPGLGGAGTLPRLRGLRPNLPIFLSTGHTDQTALALVSAHPGVTLLAKPFGLRELQRHLESLGLV